MTDNPSRRSARELTLVFQRPPSSHSGQALGVAVLIISFDTTVQTLRCLESFRVQKQVPRWIAVLDNAPDRGELLAALENLPAYEHTTLQLFHAGTNLGFAAGSNALIEWFMRLPECSAVVLLNNDAVATPELVEVLHQSVIYDESVGLAGGRMHKLTAPQAVDTLGIALYCSLMPADRFEVADHFLGPTGGCAILTRRFIDAVAAPVGYVFDPRFFCYCEDTDLAMRANLLGFQPVFADQVLALHEGQASTGGGYNDFIAYHGLRNSIWMVAKTIPGRLLAKYGALFLIAQVLTVLRYIVTGRLRILFSVYRDAISGLPMVLADRRKLMSASRVAPAELDARIEGRFYRKGYFFGVLRKFIASRRTGA